MLFRCGLGAARVSFGLKVSALMTLLWLMGQAHALPSFARQTGMDCAGCHIGAYGPQLTPAGIRFKLGGYSDTDGQEGKVPVSAMVLGSWTRTRKDQDAGTNFNANNNLKMDEAALFLAGRLFENAGAFVQATYDGKDDNLALDHLDLRYSKSLSLSSKEALLGVSVNNNPSVQDPFNTLPAWGFPYIGSPFGGGTGEAASLINGVLAHRVVGASIYGFYDNAWYGELGRYRSLSTLTQYKLGLGNGDTHELGPNAYWRLGWFKDLKKQALHLGLFGWNASVADDKTTSALQSQYRDLGVDGSYQFLGTRQHVATLNASYVQEKKTDGLSLATSRLRESRWNASYHYDQTWGASVGLHSTSALDADSADLGTNGQLLQLDWTPWGKEGRLAPTYLRAMNLRLGVQYWNYSKFNGDSTSSAKDHNTLYFFAWSSF